MSGVPRLSRVAGCVVPGCGRSLPYWFAALCCLAAGSVSAAAAGSWEAGASFDYWSGDYGTDETTTLTYVPVTLKRYLSKGDVSVTVPYLAIDSSGGAVVVDGTVNAGGASEPHAGSGLGDLVLKGTGYVLEPEGRGLYLDVVGKAKLPTADEDEGLGTGELDVGIGVESSYWLDPDFNYVALADAYYTFIGDPPGVDYDNQFACDIGLGYQATPKLLASVYLNYRTALVDSGDDPASLLFFSTYKMHPQWSGDVGLELGLTDGEADWGVIIGMKHRY